MRNTFDSTVNPAAPVAATVAHTGHIGTSGVQGHSCGPLFPWSIVGEGSLTTGGCFYAIRETYDVHTPRCYFAAGDREAYDRAYSQTEAYARQEVVETDVGNISLNLPSGDVMPVAENDPYMVNHDAIVDALESYADDEDEDEAPAGFWYAPFAM